MEIKTISTRFILNIFVNCYIIKNEGNCILIDTGMPGKRSHIEKELESAGCQPDNLKLIVLTHGDKDHCGNAAFLRSKFGAEIAMHRDDLGMVSQGDMFWNRKRPNFITRLLFGTFFSLGKEDRFKPNFYIDDGYDLSQHGLNAKVISIPGHSKGSIGILTKDGDFFCGDLLANTKKPGLWSIIDEVSAANASVKKIMLITKISTVYPGHGKPFSMKQLNLKS